MHGVTDGQTDGRTDIMMPIADRTLIRSTIP